MSYDYYSTFAGVVEGVYRSRDAGVSYEHCSQTEFLDIVTLPTSWLWCSGAHEITVVKVNATGRD